MRSLRSLPVLILLISTVVGPASAIFVGDPLEIPGNSWTLTGFQWTNSGASTMDVFRGDIIPGTGSQGFAYPGMTLGSGWSINYLTSTIVQGAAGTPITPGHSINWTATFDGASAAAPLYTIWTSYHNGLWNEAFILTNDASYHFAGLSMFKISGNYYGQSVGQADWDPGVIPEPSTLAFLLLGFGAFGVQRFLRRKP